MTGADRLRPRWLAGVSRDARVWSLIAVLALAAALLHARLLHGLAQVGSVTHLPWVVLVVGFMAAELAGVHVRVGRQSVSFSLSEVLLVLSLFLSTPTETVSASVLGGGVVLMLRSRQPLQKLLFNAAHTWLGAVLAVALWRSLSDPGDPYSLRSALAALLAGVTVELAGAVCTTAVIALHSGERPARPVGLGTGVLVSTGNGCFALVALDVVRVDWHHGWAVLVLVAVLALAQRSHLAQVKRNDGLEDLQRFAQRIGPSELRIDGLVREVLQGVRELLGVDLAVLELAEDRRTWRCDDRGLRHGEVGEAAVVSADVGPARRVRTLSVLVRGDAGVLGALIVVNAVPTLRREDQRLLEAAAGHVAMALQNVGLAERLGTQVLANERQALHDALTGLPNRLLFERRAAQALASGGPVAVLLLDLDRFKEINDTLGHACGDAVLREVGARLQRLQSHSAGVARLGGDEFAVVLQGAEADEEGARRAAERISGVLARPLQLQGVPLVVDASIGIAVAPHHGADVATLLRSADIAMYAAKGRQLSLALYDPTRDDHSTERLTLVAELRDAIPAGQLRLAYQPQTALLGRRVLSVEALVRWEHPVRGLMPPDEFIGVAEGTGLIAPLTDWVVDEALAQCRRWSDEGLDLGIAINISPRTLHDDGFVERMVARVASAGVPAGRVTLEITESSLMSDPEHAIDLLRVLRGHGLRLSVDDLGVGHSSLSYLKRLPVHEIKIDRSFVTDLALDAADQAIVETLVGLVHRLGMSVVAEGVEDEQTFAMLARFGADLAQGYWMSRPLPATAVADFVKQWQCPSVLPAQRLPVSCAAAGQTPPGELPSMS